ncbi:MAG: HEAT repeat domain-containing protein [Candidatus Thorarchaeota archaeon]|nr:HEAT repeat domain-containing protein [Candidatus Thorarchaeota archaeon]
MSRKPDRVVSRALGGGESVNRLKKAMKNIFKSSEDKIQKMLDEITSIQACRDAALTGDDDLRLLAICRLGEFGAEAYESLDIALNDENPIIRTVAAGMLAYTKRSDALPILKEHTNDNNTTVKETVEFASEWLLRYGKEAPRGKTIPKSLENPTEILIDTEPIPLRTTDDVLVVNEYTITSDTLEYGITIKNEGSTPINDVSVRILTYPQEAIILVDPMTQMIETIDSGDSGSLIFGFSIYGECIEGEIITSVNLVDSKGEVLSAKAGNVFVRSLFNQFNPLETAADDFIRLKTDMKQWNREHTILAEATELHESVLLILEGKNLHVFQRDAIEREGVFMGVQTGLAEGKFSKTRIAVTMTVVGSMNDSLSKMRIDIFADDPEILQTAASDLFETIQRDLGVLEEK